MPKYDQVGILVGCLLAPACGQSDESDDETTEDDGAETDDGSNDDGSDNGAESGSEGGDGDPVSLDVDVLFVVDNSGLFGPNMAPLAAALDDFVRALEEDEFDYRVAFTTTDNGNPLCSFTTPEGGRFRAVSCLDRLDEFVFNGAEVIDYTEVCQDACSTPGLVTTDGVPWIEVSDGTANVPDGVEVAEAMRCFGLQGINGCGMESPLSSAERSVERAATEGEPEFGFFRDNSTVALVFLTDEVDCSFNPMWGSIFEPEGGRVFWTDPTAAQATSGVCWNAGVTCSGGPGTYDRCDSDNKDVEGNEGVADEAAVLLPVSSLIPTFEELRDGGSRRLLVAGLVGVPEGYPIGAAEIPYGDSRDEEFQWLYGIGPGCTQSSGEFGLPPVRLREFAEAFAEPGERHLHSICSEDYAPALRAIAEAIRERARD